MSNHLRLTTDSGYGEIKVDEDLYLIEELKRRV